MIKKSLDKLFSAIKPKKSKKKGKKKKLTKTMHLLQNIDNNVDNLRKYPVVVESTKEDTSDKYFYKPINKQSLRLREKITPPPSSLKRISSLTEIKDMPITKEPPVAKITKPITKEPPKEISVIKEQPEEIPKEENKSSGEDEIVNIPSEQKYKFKPLLNLLNYNESYQGLINDILLGDISQDKFKSELNKFIEAHRKDYNPITFNKYTKSRMFELIKSFDPEDFKVPFDKILKVKKSLKKNQKLTRATIRELLK